MVPSGPQGTPLIPASIKNCGKSSQVNPVPASENSSSNPNNLFLIFVIVFPHIFSVLLGVIA